VGGDGFVRLAMLLVFFGYLHFEITFFKDDVAEPTGADAPFVQMHFTAHCQYLQQIIISSTVSETLFRESSGRGKL
jgi:hypothetical protein